MSEDRREFKEFKGYKEFKELQVSKEREKSKEFVELEGFKGWKVDLSTMTVKTGRLTVLNEPQELV